MSTRDVGLIALRGFAEKRGMRLREAEMLLLNLAHTVRWVRPEFSNSKNRKEAATSPITQEEGTRGAALRAYSRIGIHFTDNCPWEPWSPFDLINEEEESE